MQVNPMRNPSGPLKRPRSTSPTSNKRRVPSSYSPAIYSQLPPYLTRDISTSSSGASSPHDWVTRTNELHLATPTPPAASPSGEYGGYGYEEDVGMGSQERDAMEADDSEPPPPPPDALAFYHEHHRSLPPTPALRGSPFGSHHSTPPPAPPSSPVPPHYAPSLFANVAGSPTSQALSRSSSCNDASMSDQSMDPRDVRLPTGPQRRPRSHPGPVFSMGYRADCEKCLMRVPGHYSHIVG